MKEKLLATGGILSALAASSCCIIPLALVSAGVSGAWLGNLAALAPYQPIFMTIAVVCLGAGFWLVYGRKETACETPPSVPSNRNHFIKSILWVKGVLWIGAILAGLSASANFGAGLVL